MLDTDTIGKEEVSVDAGDGQTLLHGFFEGGTYIKKSWKPFQELFSQGTKFLLIRAWDQIKDRATVIELHDVHGKKGWRISIEDAKRYGERHMFANHPPAFLSVPTQRWERIPGRE